MLDLTFYYVTDLLQRWHTIIFGFGTLLFWKTALLINYNNEKSHFDKFLFWQIDNSTNCRFDKKSLAWTMTSNIIVLLRDEGGEEKRRRDFFLMKQKSSGKQLRGDKDVTWSESKLEETLGIQSNRSFSSFSSSFLARLLRHHHIFSR